MYIHATTEIHTNARTYMQNSNGETLSSHISDRFPYVKSITKKQENDNEGDDI